MPAGRGGDVEESGRLRLAYDATRRLLQARDGMAAQAVVVGLCRALGADVVDASSAPASAVPIDLSLGETDPLLPVTDDPEVRLALSRYLVPAVADARLVAERGLRSELLVENATLDALTGLWNRRALNLAVNRAHPGDCVALVDLDHFKRINDTLGHEAGDEVLRAFARHLRTGMRDHDVVGRLGGEEFVVVLPRTTTTAACRALHRLRSSWGDVAPQEITFSAGVAPVKESADPYDPPGQQALRRADSLMYRAKQDGRDQIACHED